MKSGLRSHTPAALLIDEEYSETVAVYQAVLRSNASRPWVMAELGARWGTWASRSVAMLRHTRSRSAAYNLYVVEAKAESCDGIKLVMTKNEIHNYTMSCSKASAAAFSEWAESVPHIDLVEFDVQGAEVELIPALHELFRAKAYRLIIATHNARAHVALREQLTAAGWLTVGETKFPDRQMHARCLMKYLRGNYDRYAQYRFNWTKILKAGCYTNTPWGPVAQNDGELVMDNPRFVRKESVFSYSDTILRASELHSMGSGVEGPRPLPFSGSALEYHMGKKSLVAKGASSH